MSGLSIQTRLRMTIKRPSPEVSTSSMADIAFLLLTFFLITTVIQNHKGILMVLPEFSSIPITAPVHDRNLFTIQINSANEFLIENEPRENLDGVKEEIQRFILNNGKDRSSSDSPKEAVVSLKTIAAQPTLLLWQHSMKYKRRIMKFMPSERGLLPQRLGN